MNSNEITFTSFQAYHVPTLTKRAKKEKGLISFIFRYALPFILLDVLVVGVALFLYFVQQGVIPFLGTIFFLYSTSFILLAAMRIGFGVRYSRLFILLYIGVVLFLLGLLVLVVLIKIGIIYIFGLFGAVLFILITNFILLPVMHIGLVFWKRFARKIKTPLPCTFLSADRMNTREIVVKLGCSLALLSILGYSTFIEPNAFRVEEVEIVSDKVSEDVTILHISDIHIHSVGRYEHKVFRRIQQLNPDIIVHTGDLISVYEPEKRDRELKKLAMLFQQLTPKYGIYSVVGNHEWRLQLDWFDELAGFKTLVDEEWLIRGDAGQFRLLGLSYEKSWWDRDKALIEEWRNTAREAEFTIVMGHAPDYIMDISDLDIDLCLAGHLHGGGQVRIPFLGPIPIIYEEILQTWGSYFPREWAMGYREINNIRMNVSAGVGSGAPIRFNCPPTMTLFTVKKS